MVKRARIWTAVGVAVLAGSAPTIAGSMHPHAPPTNPLYLLVDGEGGGEGGGDETPTSYAIGSTDANAFQYDGIPQVMAYAELVHQSYSEAKVEVDNLAFAVGALLANPTEDSLAAARKAWITARPAYLRTEAFRFYDGPIEAIEGDINSWPMNEAFIDYVEGKPASGIVNGKDELSAAYLAANNQKSDEADVSTGWHAIEFLLWGQDLSLDGPGKRPATDYAVGQGNNDRRRAYLQFVMEKLVADIASLEQAWKPGIIDNYRGTFEKLDQREALGRIVNGIAILAGFEFMSERLGVALDSGDQEDEHSCFSDTTKQDYVQDLEGIKRVWYKVKLEALIATRDASLAKRVSALFLDAETKVNKLGDPWDKVLASPKDSDERKAAEDVITSLQALTDGLKDVGTNLGVLVLVPAG